MSTFKSEGIIIANPMDSSIQPTSQPARLPSDLQVTDVGMGPSATTEQERNHSGISGEPGGTGGLQLVLLHYDREHDRIDGTSPILYLQLHCGSCYCNWPGPTIITCLCQDLPRWLDTLWAPYRVRGIAGNDT